MLWIKSSSDMSVVISREPWSCEVKYKPPATARMKRQQPFLTEFERKKRSEVIPQVWIDTIHSSHLKYNSISPNVKDKAHRRHPKYTCQIEEAPIRSIITKPGITSGVSLERNTRGLRLLRNHTPWEMTRVQTLLVCG